MLVPTHATECEEMAVEPRAFSDLAPYEVAIVESGYTITQDPFASVPVLQRIMRHWVGNRSVRVLKGKFNPDEGLDFTNDPASTKHLTADFYTVKRFETEFEQKLEMQYGRPHVDLPGVMAWRTDEKIVLYFVDDWHSFDYGCGSTAYVELEFV